MAHIENMQMKYSNNIKLVIVSPCFNEEQLLKQSSDILNGVLEDLITKNKISNDSFILYVNDGSLDDSWNVIKSINSVNSRVCGINLSRNVGHQYAIMAGMMKARSSADAVITIDADLQDDTQAIERMIDEYLNGAEVVYGIKTDRKIDSWMKRLAASIFYKFQQQLGVKSIKNHADFRLLSRKALDILSGFHERNLYVRGIIPLLGCKTATVDDCLSQRIDGESKYTTCKQIRLAIDGITSFSIKPLEFIFGIGAVMLVVAIMMVVYVMISLLFGNAIAGWASIMISLWFIGAVLTMSFGLIGIYIGKIYIEVKGRPIYSIDESIGLANNNLPS